MARKKQNINIIGKAANKRIERAIPKIQRELGYGKRKRQPKKTMVVDTNPIKAKSVGDYARQYRTNVPVQFTTNKKKPRKK